MNVHKEAFLEIQDIVIAPHSEYGLNQGDEVEITKFWKPKHALILLITFKNVKHNKKMLLT